MTGLSDEPAISVTPLDFLALDMTKKVIVFIELPPTTDIFLTYKTMQRYRPQYNQFKPVQQSRQQALRAYILRYFGYKKGQLISEGIDLI